MLNKCANNDEYGIIKQLLLLLPKSSFTWTFYNSAYEWWKLFTNLQGKKIKNKIEHVLCLKWTQLTVANESNLLIL